ncbi:MAG: terminase family protein, partial [Eubacteriales bacterium]|nr:terminase family protein [Eubacteriales bacterium]
MIKKIDITPNIKQLEFFRSKAKYTAYGGARGGGKSWAMRMKLVLLALKHPGINILLLRRTLGELRENHIIPLRRLLEGTADYRDSAKEFLFANGARIKLGYLDSECDVLQYQGQAYEVIGMEEATQFTFFQYMCLTECNRYAGGMKTPFKPRMYF